MLSADDARGLALPDDDLVLPFRTVRSDVVGRVIRLGAVVDTVLSRHAYPEPVSHALGEALALTAMLGSALKVRGQAHPADQDRRSARFPGRRLRGARQAARLRQLRQGRRRPRRSQGPRRPGRAAGQGPRRHDHRSAAATRTATRASSPLDREPLVDAAHTYFRQSEQLPTFIRLAVARHYGPASGEGPRSGAGVPAG